MEELITLGNSNSEYKDQSLLIFKQVCQHNSSKFKPKVDPYEVQHIIQIDRNPNGQIYLTKDLESSLHFAASHKVCEELIHRFRFFVPSISHCRVTCQEHLVHHPSLSLYVQNCNTNIRSKKDSCVIEKCRVMITDACRNGLLKSICFRDKLRSGTRNLCVPTLSFGLTKTNCYDYKGNRSTVVGNVKPTLMKNDSKSLTKKCKELLVEVISFALSSCPLGQKSFFTEDLERLRLLKEFNISMGVKYTKDNKPVGCWISCEAFSVMFPFYLGDHRDSLNDIVQGEVRYFYV